MDQIERYLGSLLGLAVGDALGAPITGKAPGGFVPLTDMVAGGSFHLKPGQWTDDTSMALCLAESLLECGVFDEVDQLNRYWYWYKEGHWSSSGTAFDVDKTTQLALETFRQTWDPFGTPAEERAAGNKSLSRLAPVALFFAQDPLEAIHWAGESSRTTHTAPVCIDACRYFAGLVVGALQGVPKSDLCLPYYCPAPGYWKESPLIEPVAQVASGSFRNKKTPQIQASRYVVKSLEAALWAFYQTESFQEGCLMAVNLGEDADAVGAIYGQLAGAYYGRQAIPKHWRDRLVMREEIEEIAAEIHALVWA
jgi:ADP-ribosylglycohydrolase